MTGFEDIQDLTAARLGELLEVEVGLGSGEMFIAFGANPEQNDGIVGW